MNIGPSFFRKKSNVDAGDDSMMNAEVEVMRITATTNVEDNSILNADVKARKTEMTTVVEDENSRQSKKCESNAIPTMTTPVSSLPPLPPPAQEVKSISIAISGNHMSDTEETKIRISAPPLQVTSATTPTKEATLLIKEKDSSDTEDITEESQQDLEIGTSRSAHVEHVDVPLFPFEEKLRKDITDSELSAHHEDLFAPRPGKTLLWRNVNMTLATKGGSERKILDNVWGEIPRGEITAVMGPSGAGKTSLLNILAGRAASRGRIKIEADIRLDNYSVNPRNMKVRRKIAVVGQEDSLQLTATPREAIAFSARLRLPRSTTDRDIQKLTNRMLTELGLNDCADTVIGGALVKGLSGGERKRTSVGVEICCKPELILLDEPVSGLDSFSAVQLCKVLKKVASAGSSVLFTIHQPASEIFSSFDHLILLNEGSVMYQGSVADVPAFFAQRGHSCPPHYNPADFIMTISKTVPIEELCRAGFFQEDERKIGDALVLDAAAKSALFDRKRGVIVDSRPASMATQIRLLLRRELVNLARDKLAMFGRLGFTAVLSVLTGAIFLGVGKTDSANFANLQSHFGALVLCCLLCMVGTAQPALLAFPSERPVFIREYSTDHYSVVAYFTSRFILEATVTFLQVFKICAITYYMIGFNMSFVTYCLTSYALAMSSTALAVALGCAIEDPKIGQEMFPLLFVPQMLFCGFFIAPSLMPLWIAWARNVCALTFGLLVVMLEEFNDCGSSGAQANCDYLLRSVEANSDSVGLYWVMMVALFVGFRALALVMLYKKASKFF